MSGYRDKRVGALIKETVSPLLIKEFQNADTGFLTVTRVEVTADLRTARIFISVLGSTDRTALLERLTRSSGFLRKAVASRVKLKYNPLLIFFLDEGPDHEARIDELIQLAKKT